MRPPEAANAFQDCLLGLLSQVLEHAAAGDPLQDSVEILLNGLLQCTGSRHGCIGELLPTVDGVPGFRLHAAAVSGGYRPDSARPAANAALRHLGRLREAVVRTGRPVFGNDRDFDARGGLAADTFLGLPVWRGSVLVGLIVLAGRQGGYDKALPDVLAPLVRGYAVLIETGRLREERQRLVDKLARAAGIDHAHVDPLADLNNRLRSHLNIVIGHIQLFGLNPGLDDMTRDQIREIEQAGRALAAVAEELSGLSRSEARETRPGLDSLAPVASAPPGADGRVLVAEDHPINQAVLRKQLETCGCSVDVAANGAEALAQWQAGTYDLILADLNMPGMNGFELAQAVRAREVVTGGRVPIVAITAATVSDEREACLAAGMDEVLAKPVDLETLRALLWRWRIIRISASGPVMSEPERVLIALFIATTRQDLVDCRRLLWARDGRGVGDIMHKLKSAALSVGAVRFSRVAVELESAARNGRWPEVDRLFADLETALADFEATAAEAVPPPIPDGETISPEALRQAILHDEFEVHFQPKVDAAGLQPIGVEALARWRSDRFGEVPPEIFIPLAERHDLIGSLSELLLTKALFGGARLSEAGFALTVAVNLSAFWLAQPQLPEFILATIRAAGIPAERVALEIAESGAMAVTPAALVGLARLRREGLSFAIDGFNPEGWSLDWLRRMGFGEFKLGRAWMRDTARAELPASLAQARALGIAIVAEDVETSEELERARALGCDLVQGYLIAAAMPLEDLIRWLRGRP